MRAYLSFAVLVLFVLSVPLSADSTPQTLPFSQNWTNTGLITKDDDWSAVPGLVGYRGDDLTTATGTDPQTLLVDGTATPVDVVANQNATTSTAGGLLELQITDPTIGMQGSGTADAPFLLINLSTNGFATIQVSYNLRDLDGGADNAAQQFALHYRVGSTGDFSNVAAAYVADATLQNSAMLGTPVSVVLPAAADNQPLIQLRIMTTNAPSNDELVGVDDITVTGTPIGGPTMTSIVRALIDFTS